MRILIDLQGAQSASRYRGIGRYSMSLVRTLARINTRHEIFIALSGLFPETIMPVRSELKDAVPRENIRVWYGPRPVDPARRRTAEFMRESFFESLQPDVVLVTSLFEGFYDDAVTSVHSLGKCLRTAVIFYDLIPMAYPDIYLNQDSSIEYYQRKLYSLQQSDMLLAISESTAQEAAFRLEIDPERIRSISAAASGLFRPGRVSPEESSTLLKHYGISRKVVMCAPGGFDRHKNILRLIQSYARLPGKLRAEHQLLIASRVSGPDKARIFRAAKKEGLNRDELLLAGYVPDRDLLAMYRVARLFVFPSLHEGFGLPALEAMSCAVPTIGSNKSAVPEVIGLEEALFDPENVFSMRDKMLQALQDEPFRKRLQDHAKKQSARFSWDNTARKALQYLEELDAHESTVPFLDFSRSSTILIENIAPLVTAGDFRELMHCSEYIARNRRAGIKRQLLVDVSELSARDSATGIQRVVRSCLKYLLHDPPPGFSVEPVYATTRKGYRYARAFSHQFLNSAGRDIPEMPDEYMEWQRGDIFFGLDMQHHVQLAHKDFFQELRLSGVTVKFMVYDLLPVQLDDFFYEPDARDLHEKWLSMVCSTDGALCISRATSRALVKWMQNAGAVSAPGFQNDCVHMGADIESSQPSTGMPDNAREVLQILAGRPTFLCVGTIEPRKGQAQILEAFEILWKQGVNANLVFAGRQGWKTSELIKKFAVHPEKGGRFFWLDGISDEYLAKVYSVSTCLIAASINEGFGLPLIEAARNNIPIIARDIPVFREVAGEHAFFFSGHSATDLSEAIEYWLNLYRRKRHPESRHLAWSTWEQSTAELKRLLLDKNYSGRQIMVDVSELIQKDAGSGIQRVVKRILAEFFSSPPEGYRIEPVYSTPGNPGYVYAREFTARFLNRPPPVIKDEPVEHAPGDVFLGLDLCPAVQTDNAEFYQHLQRTGIAVYFVVHDIFPVLRPDWWAEGEAEQARIASAFEQWLKTAAKSTGLVCVSRSTARELKTWLEHSTDQVLPEIFVSHNGADFGAVPGTGPAAPGHAALISLLRENPTFLMVGTLEPRKGHAQALKAFELLWAEGLEVNLAMAGKKGWQVEGLVKRLQAHPETGNRLFWMENISDEQLADLYSVSACLLAPSQGEGFGLPLIEAAQHGLPIIARDIPVFREVAGDHAFYFKGTKAEELAAAVQGWLRLYHEGRQPVSDQMPWLTWKESAQNLLDILLEKSR